MPRPAAKLHKIFQGKIGHQRFSPKAHQFCYSLFMLALDAESVEKQQGATGVFGYSWFKPLWLNEKDYLKGEPKPLLARIKDKIQQLNGNDDVYRVTMLVQVRCFGLYFSPANFYFCYNKDNQCQQMLVEVSNTPWHQRHYYLVDLTKRDITDKEFQVSPFMDLNMSYHWQVEPPCDENNNLLINIENYRNCVASEKVFAASLNMQSQPLTRSNIFKVWCQIPVMTLKIFASIYWQALKLFSKRIPFIGYQSLADKKRS